MNVPANRSQFNPIFLLLPLFVPAVIVAPLSAADSTDAPVVSIPWGPILQNRAPNN